VTRIIPKSHFYPFLSSVVLFKFGAGDLFFCGAEGASSYPRTAWSQGWASRDGLGVPENLRLKCVRHSYILGTVHIIASDVSPLHSPVIIWTPCDFCLIWLLSWFWTRFLSSRRSCPKSFDLC
jgi:hypothetical protein